ncbi:MAG: hypothetical protein WCJ30_12850 [Deltaproteobacteria bacterium]
MLETKAFGPVARADLDAWVNTYGLHVTTVMDPPGTGTVTFTTWGIRETAFIVDLTTMQILTKINGSTAGTGASAVGQAIPMLLTLLGV